MCLMLANTSVQNMIPILMCLRWCCLISLRQIISRGEVPTVVLCCALLCLCMCMLYIYLSPILIQLSYLRITGRIGRTAPGEYIALYSKAKFQQFKESEKPAIMNSSLEDLIMRLLDRYRVMFCLLVWCIYFSRGLFILMLVFLFLFCLLLLPQHTVVSRYLKCLHTDKIIPISLLHFIFCACNMERAA